jgi:EAL domain-containing protein (putative c-di-GMP-specific phosphodiesterase class I)
MTEAGKNAFRSAIVDGSDERAGGAARRALQAVRTHLGMEIAYLSEFVDGRSVFREVDAPGLEAMIKVGDSQSLNDVYCRHILEGRLPEMIPDTAAEPLALAMPITKAAGIRSHMSVPIRLADGQPYGMFCCVGLQANPSFNARDLQMMKAFAELAAFEINREVEAARAATQKLARIADVLDRNQFAIVYQPIWNVATGRPAGLEALTRFAATPPRTPDLWFAEAAETGLGVALELAAIRAAMAILPSLPDSAYLAVNASPQTILSAEFAGVMGMVPAAQIVLELTEHAEVESYDGLLDALRPLRERGIRVAVDDAGAGYSSLQHILHLQPDLIKLDMALTRHVDLDPARKALAAALIAFARDTHCEIIAEGVETASELATLRALGVEKAQGYFLGRPMPREDAVALFDRTRAA